MNPQNKFPIAPVEPAKRAACGWLRNGNPPGDFHNCARCGAKTRAGCPCRSPAMENGRCRMHGGNSTGPRTASGLERCGAAHLKKGLHSKAERKSRREILDLTRCVSLSGDILRSKDDEFAAPDPEDRQLCCTATGKAIRKADQLLHRLWASATFLSFARKHARAMYLQYLSYCRLVDHPFPSRSRSSSQPLVEGLDRLAVLVDLLLKYAEIVQQSDVTLG